MSRHDLKLCDNKEIERRKKKKVHIHIYMILYIRKISLLVTSEIEVEGVFSNFKSFTQWQFSVCDSRFFSIVRHKAPP